MLEAALEPPDVGCEVVDEDDGDANDDGERDVHRVMVAVEAHEEGGGESGRDADQSECGRLGVHDPHAREQSGQAGVAREDERVAHVHVPRQIHHIDDELNESGRLQMQHTCRIVSEMYSPGRREPVKLFLNNLVL